MSTQRTPSMSALPEFKDLPSVPGQPQGCAWGIWGDDDEIGAVNLLTPDVVRAARDEIQTGRSASLDLPLDFFTYRIGPRRACEHKILDIKPRSGLYIHDDEIHFNTQGSSQWDGLTHCAIQKDGLYYNGLKHEDVLHGPKGRNGTQNWVERGGIVGRAILLDYARWRENTHQAPAHPGTSHAITIEELESVAKFQGLEFRKGDILLLRTGFSKWYSKACDSEKERIMKAGNFIGVERSLCAAQWLWNNHFAAVACDAPGFECCPVPFGTQDEVVLHEWILVHFGMPLGEVWNLEKLSELCEELGRWTCFFTSAPLYLKGGVASPPNAIAVM